ncbi:MAG: glycosyltransferase family 61 protein, partial [Pseudomonadota bacterium]
KTKNKKKCIFDHPVNLILGIPLYWHWVNEDFPRIAHAFNNNPYPIVTNNFKSWKRDFIAFVPGLKERIIEIDSPSMIEAPEIRVLTYPAKSQSGKTNAWVGKFLQNTLSPSSNHKNPKNRFYLGRHDAIGRSVENEKEVIEFLSKHGFSFLFEISKLSLQQKINLFHNAEIVIAPSGSNLTHCHAMQKGTKIIDFNHRFSIPRECGWNNMGDAVGLKWITICADEGAENERVSMWEVNPNLPENLQELQRQKKELSRLRDKNLIVNIDVLETALKYATGQKI